MAEWYDTDGGPMCADCYYGCPRPPHHATCDRTGCACPCRRDDAYYDTMRDAARARELDDRGDDQMAGIARDLEAEARPDVTALTVERFGRPTRGAA